MIFAVAAEQVNDAAQGFMWKDVVNWFMSWIVIIGFVAWNTRKTIRTVTNAVKGIETKVKDVDTKIDANNTMTEATKVATEEIKENAKEVKETLATSKVRAEDKAQDMAKDVARLAETSEFIARKVNGHTERLVDEAKEAAYNRGLIDGKAISTRLDEQQKMIDELREQVARHKAGNQAQIDMNKDEIERLKRERQ